MSDNQTDAEATAKPSRDRKGKLIFLLIIVGVFGWIYYKGLRGPKMEGWGRDWPAALAEAKETGKPVLAVFTRKRPSKKDQDFLTESLQRKEVVDALKEFGYVKVLLNTGKHSDLATKYEITETPAMVLTDAEGKLLKKHLGFLGAAGTIIQFLRLEPESATVPAAGGT